MKKPIGAAASGMSSTRRRRERLGHLGFVLVVCWALVCKEVGGFNSPRSRRSSNAECDVLKRFLENRNASMEKPAAATKYPAAADPDTGGQQTTLCGGNCCDKEMEKHLRQQAKEDFHSQIHHHSRSLLGLLATTADALRETVTLHVRQSENKTLTLFNQVYRRMAAHSKPSISSLYQAMVDYVSGANTGENLQQPLSKEMLHERFADFFARLFLIAYHHAINPVQLKEDFTEKFKNCLYKAFDEIKPFGDLPKQLANAISANLEANRVLIQALTLGKSVLAKTDGLLFSSTSAQQKACYKALLRMTHCPKCIGVAHDVMPCRGLCTNVMRGCLTEPAWELDFAWSEYVETVERLVIAVDGHDPMAKLLNVEMAFRHLDTRISDAVMSAMLNGPQLEAQSRKVCGETVLESSSSSGPQLVLPASVTALTRPSGDGGPLLGLDGRATVGAPVHLPPAAQNPKDPNQLHLQLGNFLASVVRSRTFYANLADTICEDYPEKSCWNGERVGEYGKVVVDATLVSQRYNPEFVYLLTGPNTGNKGSTNANISVLIAQLRRISKVVQSQFASTPDNGGVLADEAVGDGSGSGDRPFWDRRPGQGPDDDTDDEDADDERDDEEASGSGMGPSVVDQILPNNNNNSEERSSGVQLNISLPTLLLLGCVIAFFGV